MIGRNLDPKNTRIVNTRIVNPWIAAIGLGLFATLIATPERGVAREAWTAPESERTVPNPIEPSAESIARGKELYGQNCLVCHGDGGKADGPGSRAVRVPMPDLSDAAWAGERTDGEMFWKIATGRDPVMTEFESYIPSKDLWHIVNFVGSLSESARVEVAAASEEEAIHASDATDGVPAHGEDVAEADHAEHAEAAVADHGESHQDTRGDAHGDTHAPISVEPFDRDSIANYEVTNAKAPVVILLIVSILVGVIFAAFPKKEIEPPKEGGGH